MPTDVATAWRRDPVSPGIKTAPSGNLETVIVARVVSRPLDAALEVTAATVPADDD